MASKFFVIMLIAFAIISTRSVDSLELGVTEILGAASHYLCTTAGERVGDLTTGCNIFFVCNYIDGEGLVARVFRCAPGEILDKESKTCMPIEKAIC